MVVRVSQSKTENIRNGQTIRKTGAANAAGPHQRNHDGGENQIKNQFLLWFSPPSLTCFPLLSSSSLGSHSSDPVLHSSASDAGSGCENYGSDNLLIPSFSLSTLKLMSNPTLQFVSFM